MKPQLCLGTAQFGLAYGITNVAGQVSESEVAKLLAEAARSGIRWLDTAQAYGSSEAVIGRNLPTGHDFRVITKLPAQSQQEFTAQDSDIWEQGFRDSCGRLRLQALDALLLHSPADLNKPRGEYLEAWLLDLRQRGLVKRLGVSIYTAADLEGIHPSLLDLVQLPLSLYDQRLLQDGTIARLRSLGTAIHARSVYLQGLLLTPADRWPSWVAEEVRNHQHALETLAQERGCRLIDLALDFAKDQTDLEAVVLGTCSVKELVELRENWSHLSFWCNQEWKAWALQESTVLNPRTWPSRESLPI